MREDICSIPISEVFEPRDGCPICRMRDIAEQRGVEYTLGAAMMEPDVRQMTNKLGFCGTHYEKMIGLQKRLPLGLVLESHLAHLKDELSGGGLFGPPAKKTAYKTAQLKQTCFVCERMEWAMSRMVSSIYRLYDNERDFRTLFAEQPQICLPHFTMLIEGSAAALRAPRLKEFQAAAKEILLRNIDELHADLKHFCSMFDYRNNTPDADWGTSRDSIERSIAFLTAGKE